MSEPDDAHVWRQRARRMVSRLRCDLKDEDWRDAMTILARIAALAHCEQATRTATLVSGASGAAVQGLACRRAALADLCRAF